MHGVRIRTINSRAWSTDRVVSKFLSELRFFFFFVSVIHFNSFIFLVRVPTRDVIHRGMHIADTIVRTCFGIKTRVWPNVDDNNIIYILCAYQYTAVIIVVIITTESHTSCDTRRTRGDEYDENRLRGRDFTGREKRTERTHVFSDVIETEQWQWVV